MYFSPSRISRLEHCRRFYSISEPARAILPGTLGAFPPDEHAITIQESNVCSLETAKPFPEIPGPSGLSALPYIGVLFQFYPFSEFGPKNFIGRLAKWREEYGPIMKFRVFNKWSVCLFEPDDIQQVYRHEPRQPIRGHIDILEIYGKRENMFPSLLSLTGDDWMEQRQAFQNVISKPRDVAKYAPLVSNIADDFVKGMEGKDELYDVYGDLINFTTEILGATLFGERLGAVEGKKEAQELMTSMHKFLILFGEASFHVIKPYSVFRTKFYNEYAEVQKNFAEMTKTFIHKIQQQLQEGKLPEDHKSLISDFLKSGNMDEPRMIRGLMDMLMGGADSTANTITFALFHLAKNPDKQEKLYQELSALLPRSSDITASALQNLPYLKACVKESMRCIFPTQGGTQRILQKAMVVRGYQIPEGTTVLLNPGIICRDPGYFPQPSRYMPERWMRGDPACVTRHPFCFLPFGFGPRNCIGQRFAEQEIHIFLAKLLLNYRIRLPPGVNDISYQYYTFAMPTDKVTFTVQKRTA